MITGSVASERSSTAIVSSDGRQVSISRDVISSLQVSL